LIETFIDEGVRAVAMESRSYGKYVVLGSSYRSFRSIRFFLVGIDEIPLKVQTGGHGAYFRARLVVHSQCIEFNILLAEELYRTFNGVGRVVALQIFKGFYVYV
jgi:hypothetical protein